MVFCSGQDQTVTNGISIANDGAALTWALTLFIDSDSVSVVPLYGWTATLNTTRTINVTVTRTTGTGSWGAGMFAARNSLGFGAVEQFDSGTGDGQPVLNITTQAPNSAIFCLNADWNALAGARTYYTATAGTATEYLYDGTTGNTYVVEAFAYLDAGATGTKTIGLSAPAAQRFVFGAIEILGSPTVQDEGSKNQSAMSAMRGR